jgi:hypothetical protein
VVMHRRLEVEAEVKEAVCCGARDETAVCSRAGDEAAACSRDGREDTTS